MVDSACQILQMNLYRLFIILAGIAQYMEDVLLENIPHSKCCARHNKLKVLLIYCRVKFFKLYLYTLPTFILPLAIRQAFQS